MPPDGAARTRAFVFTRGPGRRATQKPPRLGKNEPPRRRIVSIGDSRFETTSEVPRAEKEGARKAGRPDGPVPQTRLGP